MYPGAWLWLLPGLLAQAGSAEEVLFRGYLFGRLHRGRGLWRAAGKPVGCFCEGHTVLISLPPTLEISSMFVEDCITRSFVALSIDVKIISVFESILLTHCARRIDSVVVLNYRCGLPGRWNFTKHLRNALRRKNNLLRMEF